MPKGVAMLDKQLPTHKSQFFNVNTKGFAKPIESTSLNPVNTLHPPQIPRAIQKVGRYQGIAVAKSKENNKASLLPVASGATAMPA